MGSLIETDTARLKLRLGFDLRHRVHAALPNMLLTAFCAHLSRCAAARA